MEKEYNKCDQCNMYKEYTRLGIINFRCGFMCEDCWTIYKKRINEIYFSKNKFIKK